MKSVLILITWQVAAFVAATAVSAEEIAGFTQPHRTANVSAVEVAVVDEIRVKEGDTVKQGDILATLEHEVLKAALAVAEKAVEAQGRQAALVAELQLQKARLRKLEQLLATGHGRPEEIDRARAAVAIAEGQLLAWEEELVMKQLECNRIKTQIDRRFIRAPFAGVVSRIHKEVGEHISPNSADLLTVVQVDQLLAVFAVPQQSARELSIGEQVSVTIGAVPTSTPGVIEAVSPLVDAESGTVRIKVRIKNAAGEYRSGQQCLLKLKP